MGVRILLERYLMVKASTNCFIMALAIFCPFHLIGLLQDNKSERWYWSAVFIGVIALIEVIIGWILLKRERHNDLKRNN